MQIPAGNITASARSGPRSRGMLVFLGLLACAVAFCMAALCACGSSGGTGASVGGEATGADYTQPSSVDIPDVSDKSIDTSGVDEGWVSASQSSSSKLKFQVIHGDETYNYDLPNDGTPTIFPINMGDGTYKFRIMKNTQGKSYVELDSKKADVELDSEQAPFLIPNQICNYTASSDCVSTAREVTADADNEGEVVALVCTYVADHISYDTAKAEELATSSGYVPDPDATLSEGTGICFDYASLSAAMLRSMGMPAKVITGYVGEDELYHAWIMVYADGTWQTAMFSVTPNEWSRCDVTFASTGATQFVGSGESYTDRYVY